MNTEHSNNNGRHPQAARLSTADLFEMASLDALGLLDEQERRSFEDAFASAPASVKSQIRDQQSRMAEIDAFLPRVSPPAYLRDKVVAAVSAAMRSLPGMRTHEGGRTIPTFLPSRGVSPIWRAVAIGCAAAVAFFSVATVQMYNNSREMDAAFRTGAMLDTFKDKFGQRFRTALTSPNTQFVKFSTPTNAEGRKSAAQAVLLMDQGRKSGMFFCFDLPEQTGTYALVTISPDGTVGTPIATFQASGGATPAPDLTNLDIPAGSRLGVTALNAADPQPVILTSDNL
ncbi:MAG: hypothetical protein ACT4PL_03980 [Phycisphaerales bacterium]